MWWRKRCYNFAAACNPWDKAEKPLKREWMSSPDGEIRGGQRTMLEETRKMNSVHFTRCFLLAIIVKYFRQRLHGSGSDTICFSSGEPKHCRGKCDGCSITTTYQTLSCSLQTYFLHNLFPSSFICQCVHLHSNVLMFPPWIATVHSRGCHWSLHWTGLCRLICVLAWMTLFLPDQSHHRMGVTTLYKCNVHIQVKVLFNVIEH